MTTRRTVKEVASFEAIDESGKRHRIRIFQQFLHVTPLSGVTESVAGVKAYKMPNGNHVNVNDDGTLLEVATGRTLRKIA